MICIVCPVGCHISVDQDHHVTGNKCPRGEAHGIKEATDPRRVLTTSVRTTFETMPRLSVKSREAVPKGIMFDIIDVLDHVLITKPITIGDVVIKDVLGTGIDIISTKSIDLRYNEHEDVIE